MYSQAFNMGNVNLQNKKVMLNSFRKLSGRNLAGPARNLAFFILYYLYLWLKVDMRLIYHGGGMITNFPVFYRGWAFFQEFIVYPGGLVEYLSAFLSQFLYYSWAGALVITLQAWLFFICTGYFLKAINAPRLYWIRFIPPILLLIAYSQYTYYFVTTMALLAALFFVCLYLRTDSKSKFLRAVLFLVLSVILYTIAGGAYLLFAGLCATYELLLRRRWQLGLLYSLLALIIPYVQGVLVFGVSIIDAFGNLLPVSWKILSYKSPKRMITVVCILYLLLPLTTVGLELWRILVRHLALQPEQEGQAHFLSIKKTYLALFVSGSPILRWTIESVVLFAVAGAVFFWHDDKRKTLFAVDYYAYHRMWPQVLASARHHPNSYFIVHAVNRALYHTGRLNYEMLCYPQHPATLFLPIKEHVSVSWKRCDTYIDLGLINKAEHELIESMETFGERPTTLQRLALINMVKGNISTAQTYLGALAKTLFETGWANNYLHRLERDPDLSTDNQIQHLRCLTLENDYPFSLLNDEQMLLELLENNRQNRMAFEYLMAWYLLGGQLEEFTQNLDRLDDFNYSEIPRLYEEAILYSLSRGKSVDLHGRQVSPESRQRFAGFVNIYNRHGRNKQAAFNKLAKDYGNSCFFYYLYRRSGMKK